VGLVGFSQVRNGLCNGLHQRYIYVVDVGVCLCVCVCVRLCVCVCIYSEPNFVTAPPQIYIIYT
jgi:hypothetical protein